MANGGLCDQNKGLGTSLGNLYGLENHIFDGIILASMLGKDCLSQIQEKTNKITKDNSLANIELQCPALGVFVCSIVKITCLGIA